MKFLFLFIFLFVNFFSCSNITSPSDKKPIIISCTNDTTISINDSLVLFVVNKLNFQSLKYKWILDSSNVLPDTDSICTLYFSKKDTGNHIVTVVGITQKGIESLPQIIRLTVNLNPPKLNFITKDTTLFTNDTLIVYAKANDSNGKVIKYYWFFNNKVDSTDIPEFKIIFNNIYGTYNFYGKCIDDDIVFSNLDSIKIKVILDKPVLAPIADTAIFFNDSVTFNVQRTDTFKNYVFYVWQINNLGFKDTTKDNFYSFIFTKNMCGNNTISVKAINSRGIESDSVLANVFVKTGKPIVRMVNQDTTVAINDTIIFNALGFDTNGVIKSYVWADNSNNFLNTTFDGKITYIWNKQDTGIHTIKVKAIDDDTIESDAVSIRVTVKLFEPVLMPVSDTFATRGNTIKIYLSAKDINGVLEKYYWKFDNEEKWQDSLDEPILYITNGFAQKTNIIIGVRDDDLNFVFDTFSITFNPLPCSLNVFKPKSKDTIYVYSNDLPLGKALFEYSAMLKNLQPDSFTYSIYAGKALDDLVKRYSGKDTSVIVGAFDTGKCYYKIIGVSSHNDSAIFIDSVYCIWKRKLCFIGHSIVTGTGGSLDSGGFRRIVIDSLKSLLSQDKKLKMVGPYFSGILKPYQEDSSLAIPSKTAYHIYDSLFNNPYLTADAWVYMIGVNGGYTNYEWWYTVATIDLMHKRNPKSEIYVLTPIPLPRDTSDTYYTITNDLRHSLTIFSQQLDSAVLERNKNWLSKEEGGIWMVDVFTPLADTINFNIKDSVYNPIYYNDLIHPNQLGYNVMGKEIIKVIKANTRVFVKD